VPHWDGGMPTYLVETSLAGSKKLTGSDGSASPAALISAQTVFSKKSRTIYITINSNVMIATSQRRRKLYSLYYLLFLKFKIFFFMVLRIIIYCWPNGKGPDSRIELKGLYPGALVNISPEWPYGREVNILNQFIFMN